MKPEQKQEQAVTPQREIAVEQSKEKILVWVSKGASAAPAAPAPRPRKITIK